MEILFTLWLWYNGIMLYLNEYFTIKYNGEMANTPIDYTIYNNINFIKQLKQTQNWQGILYTVCIKTIQSYYFTLNAHAYIHIDSHVIKEVESFLWPI